MLDSFAELHELRTELQDALTAQADQVTAAQPLSTLAQHLVLVASELATNAIRHGRPPTIVELHQHEARFLLTVADHDLSSEPRLAGDRPPGQGGFGLQIARRLSADVAWYRTETTKVVWAELNP